MNPQAAKAAAECIWQAWTEERRIDAIPESFRPRSRAEGYAVQRQLAEVSGQATLGWKIAATSQAGQAHLRVDGPLAGRLLAGRVGADGASIRLGNNGMRVAEAEFAFRLRRDLPSQASPYEFDEVLEAIDTLHPAIEVPDSRFRDFCAVGDAQLIADDACAFQFVLGEPVRDWRHLDLATHVVRVLINGVPMREGKGANVLEDPRRAMHWIANELRVYGPGLRSGDIVTTGTAVVPVAIEPGCRVLADFGSLGQVTTMVV
ncbi:MAG: hydratase [Verrucomicrobia bacterium]|nr:hydratase [Verrucomicrobiota bacterium]